MTGKAIFLHLSDLHFGDENETNSAKRTNTLDKLLLTLKALPNEWKPQSITISGDIGWHGLEKDYNIAETWLKKLLKTLALSPNDIIPAPGNHDINLKKAATAAIPSDDISADELLDLDLLENLSAPFKAFVDFCKRMAIPPLTLGSKSSYLSGSRVHKGVTWLVLNSAWFCRENREEKLHIGLPHLEVITAAESWKKRDIPTIGVLHHPPSCLQDEESNSYGSRRNTYDFLAGECDMILSGHVHGMLKAPDTMHQKSYLFMGGSSYKTEKVRNNFSIFRVDISSGGIERRAYEWNPGDGEWEYREKFSDAYAGSEGGPDLHRRLFADSRRHYEDLRGENGRFRHLDISDIILQPHHMGRGLNKEWLDSPIKSFSGGQGAARHGRDLLGPAPRAKKPLVSEGTLFDVFPRLWQEGCKHAVVKGDGGMGKTVSLVRLWDEFTKHYDAAGPVRYIYS